MELSRTNPSEEYTWCLSNYTELHQGGKLFDGRSLKKFIRLLNGLIKTNRCETLLDYGSGQGMLYGPHFAVLTGLIDKPLADYWGVDVDLYEPGLPEHESLPMCWSIFQRAIWDGLLMKSWSAAASSHF